MRCACTEGLVARAGEADASIPAYYECAFPNMIEDWRQGFASPSLWFIGVQLAPYILTAPGFAPLRQSQLSIFELGNTALVTAMDLGDALSPFSSVHPRAKQPVGARLAANALAQVYGKALPHLSPRFLNATGSVDGEFVTVSITFVQESVVDGLQLVPGASCPISEGVPASQCSGFVLELSGPSGYLLVNATVAISDGGKAVTLSAQAPTAGYVPVTTQSCYNSWPIATLYTQAGFPAFPWNAPVYPAA